MPHFISPNLFVPKPKSLKTIESTIKTLTFTKSISCLTSIPKTQKRIRDEFLDHHMEMQKKAQKVLKFQTLILSQANQTLPISRLDALAQRMGYKQFDTKAFVHELRLVFEIYEHPIRRVPYCRLTQNAHTQIQQERDALLAQLPEAVSRLRKLIMMSISGRLNLGHIRLARLAFGLPDDFEHSIVRKNPQFFRLIDEDSRDKYIEIVDRDPKLAVCEIERTRDRKGKKKEANRDTTMFSFRLNFPPGLKLSQQYKLSLWLWQRMPYRSPYECISLYHWASVMSHESWKKRLVATIHEVLSLTVEKKIALDMLAHFRLPLNLPKKLKEFLLQYQGIFYISTRGNQGKLHTVFLREAYKNGELVEPSDLYLARRKLVELVFSPREVQMDSQLVCYEGDVGNGLLENGCHEEYDFGRGSNGKNEEGERAFNFDAGSDVQSNILVDSDNANAQDAHVAGSGR